MCSLIEFRKFKLKYDKIVNLRKENLVNLVVSIRETLASTHKIYISMTDVYKGVVKKC